MRYNESFKETSQNPGPNFHFSEKVQIMHSTIFFKIHVFPRKYIIPLQTEGENNGNGMNDAYITLRFRESQLSKNSVLSCQSQVSKACFLHDPNSSI